MCRTPGTPPGRLVQRPEEPRRRQEERQGRRLPAGQHDPAQPVEVGGGGEAAPSHRGRTGRRCAVGHPPAGPVPRSSRRDPGDPRSTRYQPGRRGARRGADLLPPHGLPETCRDLGHEIGVGEMGRRLDDGPGPPGRVVALEDTRADEDGLAPPAASPGRRRPAWRCPRHRTGAPAGVRWRRPPGPGRSGPGAPWPSRTARPGRPADPAEIAQDGPEVPDGLHDVAGAGLALGPDHRRALRDPPEGLAEVGRPAHERDVERPLVDVVRLVGGSQDFALVDVVDPQ